MCWRINRIYGYTAKRFLIAGSLFAILLNPDIAKGQQCVNFHTKYCISYSEQGYTPVQVSRSYLMQKGDYKTLNIDFNKGQDYHISFAVDDIFAQKLYIQIIDRNHEKIIYDNTKDDMSLNMEFSAIKDIDGKIFIETPASKVQEPRYNPSGCIGILIETRPTPAMGFPDEE